ncbi:hypothetical protein AJ79_01417 [Helicocarpus griseus UAMH5409]|uniref:DUF2293 domain-containing protein n=1 Tax=Helicocarpus griseus UAMH5409 TaxID=1447875 RepID=A0A2B7Y7M2_9EURO|nr:hypothetical protein AJ79_01417 [Helicocarpus griseus UAMH5409]
MTRVVGRATSAQAVRAQSRLSKPRLRKHKIIMESITQEKKKLRSVISFEAKAPPGYTFIPAGNPKFTNACKEMCRKDGLQVFAVSTTPHQRMHDLSQQVHRIGYHFPSVVVATICMEKGLFLSSTGKVVPYQAGSSSHFSTRAWGQEKRTDSEQSQNTINAEARDAIKDLFPNIPTKDLNRIIKTAFQKGKRKVGTAVELPLARRAQLAVVAHIRHVYTDYDRLLRVTSFQDARAAVEEPCLAKLVQWRGDDENGKTVLEDVFREVIVISDDEGEDEDESDPVEGGLNKEGRDSSVEIVSSNALTGELQTKPVNYGNIPPAEREAAQDLSEDEAPSGFRFVPQPLRRKKAPEKKRPDRRGFSRYQAWDRARDKYRDGGFSPLMARTDGHLAERYSVPPTLHPLTEAGRSHIPPFAHEPIAAPPRPLRPFDSTNEVRFHQPLNVIDRPPLQTRPYLLESHKTRPAPPDRIQLADGAIFERASSPTWHELGRSKLAPILISPGGPTVRPEERRHRLPAGNLHSPSHRGGDLSEYQEHRVLPSIEGPESPGQFRSQPMENLDQLSRKRAADDFPSYHMKPTNPQIEEVSGNINRIDINEDRHIFPQKRQRLDHTVRGNSPSERGRDRNLISLHQGQIEPPNHRNPGGPSDVSYFHAEKQQPPVFYELPEVLGRHPDRISIGTKRPLGPISPIAHFPSGSSDNPGHGRRFAAPILHEHHQGVSSQSLLESRIISSNQPGYMVRTDDRSVRPNHFSTFSRPQPQPVDHEDFVDPTGPSSFRDPGHSYVVAQDPPVRRNFLLDENTRVSSLQSPDFVRPVNVQDADDSFRHEPYKRPTGPVSPRQTRYVPVRADHGAFKAYDKLRAESQADRSHSPQAFTSRAPVSGPRSAFYVGQDSAPRSDRTFMNPLQPASTFYEPRSGRLPVDDGRHRDDIQHHTVIRDDVVRRRPEERPLYYERIPPQRPIILE